LASVAPANPEQKIWFEKYGNLMANRILSKGEIRKCLWDRDWCDLGDGICHKKVTLNPLQKLAQEIHLTHADL
jgi:hypothetical protein